MSVSSKTGSVFNRWLMYGVGLLSSLLILVVVNSFFHSDENPLNPVAAAAERTQSQPGARFTIKALYTSTELPRPLVARGEGAYNSETGLSEARLRVDSPTKGWVTVNSVGDGTALYMGGSAFAGELPDGKEWMKIEPLLGHSQDELVLSGNGAESSFGALDSIDGDLERLGREQVRGVSTRHYRARISYDAYAALLRDEGKDDLADQIETYDAVITTPPLAEAWIDDEGMLRRMRMQMTFPGPAGKPSLTMNLTTDLFAIGARPQISLPDSSRVFDATPLLRRQLDALEAD